MKRYFITIEYDGSRYHGWQIQPNGLTVEGMVENALSTLLRQPIDVIGAGRTDAGVHARMMVAHFDFEGDLGLSHVKYKINKILPKDISVIDIQEVLEDMHARFSATSRTYHYYIHTRKDPFLDRYSCYITYPLDFGLMNEAAEVLMGYTDFDAFCKSGSDQKTTLCDITEAQWFRNGDHSYYFRISANRFLRNMVRAIVGTLIDVGRGRLSIDDLRAIVEGRSRSAAGESMPANALFLEEVEY